jgi:CheY-like chemotaxis protein
LTPLFTAVQYEHPFQIPASVAGLSPAAVDLFSRNLELMIDESESPGREISHPVWDPGPDPLGCWLGGPQELQQATLTALGSNPQAHPQPAPQLITRHSLRERRRHLGILLVEDNEVNQLLARSILEKHGHNVTVAANGKLALAALRSKPFDVVLMDVQMPEMNGYEATRAIRGKESKTGGHPSIIAMTAHAMKGDEQLCLEAGMDDYLSKRFALMRSWQ